MENLKETIFYSLDKAIKSYRQFAQKNINIQFEDITIDQWLILKTLHEYPGISQTDLARNVFKDYASVTRIIDKLVTNNYLRRETHPEDRRRFKLELTDYADAQLDVLMKIVQFNRASALANISREEIEKLQEILSKITNNCQLKSNTYESTKAITS